MHVGTAQRTGTDNNHILTTPQVNVRCCTAPHVSQVAVLDEVQMLGDKARGWSWTRVLLGLPAAELHLCGDPAAAGLLEQLAAECSDQLSIRRYRCVLGRTHAQLGMKTAGSRVMLLVCGMGRCCSGASRRAEWLPDAEITLCCQFVL